MNAKGATPNGRRIRCDSCDGKGLVTTWSIDMELLDECRDCRGGGWNWQYPRGAIAAYYGGPLIGRAALKESA